MTDPSSGAARAERGLPVAAVAVIVILAWLGASWRPLAYDELFTYYVARQSSVAAVVRALHALADAQPPLGPLLRHASMALLGDSPGAFRLPSLFAFVAGLLAIYGYVRPRVGGGAALAALLAPAGTAAMAFAQDGSNDALLFASGALALLAWQRAVAAPIPRRLWLLALALCVGPLSHTFGGLSMLPPALGEAWRSSQRRQLDRRIVAAFIGGVGLSLLAVPFARQIGNPQGGFAAAGIRVADACRYAFGLLQHAGSPVLLVLAAGALLAGLLAWRSPERAALRLGLPSHEWLAAVALVCVPLPAAVLAAARTSALTAHDVAAFVPGVAIVLGYLVARVAKLLPRTAWMAVGGLAALAFTSQFWTLADALEQELFPTPMRQAIELSSLPIAFDTPQEFLEYGFQAPDLAHDRFVYPMDAALARRLRGSDVDEVALRDLARIVPLHVTSYVEFASRTPEFLLVRNDRHASALARQLPADGFCLDELLRSGAVVLLHVTWNCDG